MIVEVFVFGYVDESEGVEESFELIFEINELVSMGIWVGDCFIYINIDKCLNYCVGGEVMIFIYLDCFMFILGYFAA